MSPPPEEALFIHPLPVDLGAVVMLTALDLIPLFSLASWLSLWNLTLNSHLQPAPPLASYHLLPLRVSCHQREPQILRIGLCQAQPLIKGRMLGASECC